MGWKQIEDYPIGVSIAQAVEGPNGNLIGIAGENTSANATNRCFRFKNGTWNEIASLNQTRSDFAAATDSDGNPIVVGGIDANFNGLKSVERFENGSWNYITEYPHPIDGASSFVGFDDNIHVVGGNNRSTGDLRIKEHFILDGNSWIEATSMSESHRGIEAIKGPSGDYIVFTSSAFDDTATHERWDGNSWTSFTGYTQGRGAYFRSPSGSIAIVGGINEDFGYIDTVTIYDGSTFKSAESYPIKAQFLAASSFENGNPICFGGSNYGSFGRTNRAYQYIPPEPPTAPTGLTVDTQ